MKNKFDAYASELKDVQSFHKKQEDKLTLANKIAWSLVYTKEKEIVKIKEELTKCTTSLEKADHKLSVDFENQKKVLEEERKKLEKQIDDLASGNEDSKKEMKKNEDRER